MTIKINLPVDPKFRLALDTRFGLPSRGFPCPGEDGEDGLPGLSGEMGISGEPGEQGDPGISGEPGQQGDPGISGEPGEQGEPGISGEPGEQGSEGPQGPQGEQGLSGESCYDTLDTVCDRGNETDQDIHTSGDLYVDHSGMFGKDVFLNWDGPGVPGSPTHLYFYHAGSPTGASLLFENGWERFEFSENLYVNGSLYVADQGVFYGAYLQGNNIRARGYLMVNSDYASGDEDAQIFFNGPYGSNEAEMRWDHGNWRFEFSDRVFIDGNLTINNDLEVDDDARIKDDLTVGGDVHVSGHVWATEELSGEYLQLSHYNGFPGSPANGMIAYNAISGDFYGYDESWKSLTAGEVGISGEPGEAGPQGDPGISGEPGEQGDPGISGEPGQQGETGESAAGLAFWYHSEASADIPAYRRARRAMPHLAEVILSTVVNQAAGEVLIDEWVTSPFVPGVEVIYAGEWSWHGYYYVDNAAGDTFIKTYVYKRTQAGVETELFNVTSDEIDNLAVALDIYLYTQANHISLSETDRLVFKAYAYTSSVANRTVYMVIEGTDHSTHVHSTIFGPGIDYTLDYVCDIGNETDQDIHSSGTIYADVDFVTLNCGSLCELSGYYHGLSGEFLQHLADFTNPHQVTFNQARDQQGGSDVTLAELEELTDASVTALHSHAGAGADTLDNVCDRGNETDQDIHTSGDLYVDGSGTFGDQVVVDASGVFYEEHDEHIHISDFLAGLPGLMYNTTAEKWQFSHDGSTWADIGSGGNGAGAGSIILPVEGAALGDGTAGSAAPSLGLYTTSDADDPQLRMFGMGFDDTTDEHCFWQFRMPENYGSGGKLKIQFYMDDDQADDTKTVQFEASLIAVTPNADADEMTSLDATNDSGGWVAGTYTLDYANPALDDRLCEVEIDLSSNLDNLAAGDYVVLSFRRDAGDDDASGDAIVIAVNFQYLAM